MTRGEFVTEFASILGLSPEALTPETEMGTIETWDSVAYLMAMLLIDEKLGISVPAESLSGARTFAHILEAVGPGLEN